MPNGDDHTHNDHYYDPRRHTFHVQSNPNYPYASQMPSYQQAQGTSWTSPQETLYSQTAPSFAFHPHSSIVHQHPRNASISFPTPSPFIPGHTPSPSLTVPGSHHHPMSPLSASSNGSQFTHSRGRSIAAMRRKQRKQEQDDLRPEKYRPSIGGPPKAKLGGPGGKTYDEMSAEKSIRRKLESDTTPQPATQPCAERDGEATNEKVGESNGNGNGTPPSRWRGKPIEIKPPPERYSPPSSPLRPAQLEGLPCEGEADETESEDEAVEKTPRKEAFPWPHREVRTSPTGIALPPSPVQRIEKYERPPSSTAGSLGSNRLNKEAKWKRKEVSLALPDESGWAKLLPSPNAKADDLTSAADDIDAAGVPLPESEEDDGSEGYSKRGSVDLYRAGAIREPPPPEVRGQVALAESTIASGEGQGTPLRRTGAFIGNAAFIRKQLGGVLRPEREVSPARNTGTPTSQSSEGRSLDGDAQSPQGRQVDGNVEDSGDAPEAVESPVSRALRLLQSSLNSVRPAQNAKRKQDDLAEDAQHQGEPAAVEKRENAPMASRKERATIGPKMGRYLQGQLSGFLKPKGERSKRSNSPGSVLHGLDIEEDDIARPEHDSPTKTGINDEERELLPALGGGSLGLFTFTSQLRPTAGSFKPREASLRAAAPSFTPLISPAASPRDSTASPDVAHKRLRGDAPIFQPTSSGHTSRHSTASFHSHSSPVKPQPASPSKVEAPLRLRPLAAAFIPSHLTQLSTGSPSSAHQPLSPATFEEQDASSVRRGSTQEPGAIFLASKALRAEATSFVPSELPRSPGGSRTSSSTLRMLESWREKGGSSGSRTPAAPSPGTSGNVSPIKSSPELDCGAAAPTPLSDSFTRAVYHAQDLLKPDAIDVSPISSPAPRRYDMPRSAAPSPDSRRPMQIPPAVCGSETAARNTGRGRPSSPSLSTSMELEDVTVNTDQLVTDLEEIMISAGDVDETQMDAERGEVQETIPDTPRMTTTSSTADTTTYATVDGSPLIPSRNVAPTRPHFDSSQEPLRASPPSDPASLATAPMQSPDSGGVLTFEQAEVTVDEAADDRRFRKWTFPAPTTGEGRPPLTRRHTSPNRDQDIEEEPSSNEQSLLSARLEDFRESLSSASPTKERPTIPFLSKSYDEGLAAVLAKFNELFSLLRETQVRHEQKAPSPKPATPIDIDSMREVLFDLEGSILYALHDRTHHDRDAHNSNFESILKILKDQSSTLSLLHEASGTIANVHTDIWAIDAAHKEALESLSMAQDHAIFESKSMQSRSAVEVGKLFEELAILRENQAVSADAMQQLADSQPQVQDLEAKIRALEGEVTTARADVASMRQKMDMDEKRHKVVESKLTAVKTKLDATEQREATLQKDFEDVLAGKMAAERVRNELSEAMVDTMNTAREQREELARLKAELEAERAKPPPPTQSGLHGDELDSIRVASESLRTDIMAQLEALSSGMREQANSSKSENERLEAQTRYLHTQVTTLQEQLDLARAEKSASEGTLGGELSSAESEIKVLRAQLEQESAARQTAENRRGEADETAKCLSEKLLDSRMIARDRLATCRMNEVRLQALAQETHYWRHYALSYDRKEFSAFMASNPRLLKGSSPVGLQDTSPTIQTPAASNLLAVVQETQATPTKGSMASIPENSLLGLSTSSSPDL